MPKHYKAQLDHKPFDLNSAFDTFAADLETRREQILETVGFYEEYERTNDPLRAAYISGEADEIMKEIASVLTKGAAIRIEAGFKSAGETLATVRAIYRDPGLITRASPEDEALCMVAQRYQRGTEKPGTHWYDVTDGIADPTLDGVRTAARRAMDELEGLAKRGRRKDVTGDHLAQQLGSIFNRFAGPIGLTVETAGYGANDREGERGRFKDFLELVLPALEAILCRGPGGWRDRDPSTGAAASLRSSLLCGAGQGPGRLQSRNRKSRSRRNHLKC